MNSALFKFDLRFLCFSYILETKKGIANFLSDLNSMKSDSFVLKCLQKSDWIFTVMKGIYGFKHFLFSTFFLKEGINVNTLVRIAACHSVISSYQATLIFMDMCHCAIGWAWTHGLSEKRLDLLPREVHFFSEIREWYFSHTLLHQILLLCTVCCVLCRRISQWAGAKATVNAALPSEVD